MSTFTLDLIKPEPMFGTPTGGTTAMPLNSDWFKPDNITRYGVNFAVSDVDGFDFGTILPGWTIARSFWKYGDKLQDYSRKDRSFKCTVYVQGDTIALMKYGVQQLQATIAEATEYTVSSFNNNGLGASIGSPLYLKYTPDATVPPVYFRVITGLVDLAKATEQIHLLQGFCEVTLDLRISYTGQSDAVWLQNLVPNGTFAYGFSGYTTTGSTIRYDGTVTTTPGPGTWNWWMTVPGKTPVIYNQHDSPETGMETAWGLTGAPGSETWSAATYSAGNQAGSDILYTPEYSLSGSSNTDTFKLWLAFEYFDNAAVGSFCSAQLQVWQTFSGGAWVNVGSAVVPTNNTGSFARYSWGAPLTVNSGTNPAGGEWRYVYKYRIAFTMDRSRSASTQAWLRRIALWSFPAIVASAMVKLPSEYVSQPLNITQNCVVTGIQGNLETPVRVKVANPTQTVPNGATAVTYQQIYIGARKYQRFPFKFYYDYTTAQTIQIAVGQANAYANVQTDNTRDDTHLFYGIPVADMRPRQYRVLARMSTDQPCGIGISVRKYGGAIYPDYTIVPNGTVTELPNTSTVIQTLDCGVATLPANTSQNSDDASVFGYSPIREPDLFFTRTVSTNAAAAVNIVMKGVWLIPVDEFNAIDTRAINTLGSTSWFTPTWHNYIDSSLASIYAAATAAKELVIDSLNKNIPAYFMGSNTEWDNAAFAINPSATANLFIFYPATINSPEPMMFGSVIRRVGTNGTPNTDVTKTDGLSYSFLYCPAYEF